MKKTILLITVLFAGFSLCAQDFEAGEKMFNSNCKACHSIGGGRLVGPDLKGVTERRKEDWLLEFIKTPTKMIEKDAEAKKLFEEYDRMPMPDHAFLSDTEIKNMLAFIDNYSEPEAKEESEPEVKIEEAQDEEQAELTEEATTFFDYLLYTLVGVAVLLALVAVYLIIQVSNLITRKKEEQ